jgi:hypothetical protein
VTVSRSSSGNHSLSCGISPRRAACAVPVPPALPPPGVAGLAGARGRPPRPPIPRVLARRAAAAWVPSHPWVRSASSIPGNPGAETLRTEVRACRDASGQDASDRGSGVGHAAIAERRRRRARTSAAVVHHRSVPSDAGRRRRGCVARSKRSHSTSPASTARIQCEAADELSEHTTPEQAEISQYGSRSSGESPWSRRNNDSVPHSSSPPRIARLPVPPVHDC